MTQETDSVDIYMSEADSLTAQRPTGTRSSACLAEKLKKLMETPSTTSGEPMECDQDEVKK